LAPVAGVESRCLVPFTSFAENEHLPDGRRPPVWFAFNETRPLAFFAGIWTRWTSVRKVKEGETTNELFAFLTTDANKVVGAIHPKAMPVILTKPEEFDTWMAAPPKEALKLQRRLSIVARGEKEDLGGLRPSQDRSRTGLRAPGRGLGRIGGRTPGKGRPSHPSWLLTAIHTCRRCHHRVVLSADRWPDACRCRHLVRAHGVQPICSAPWW
jgi:hypothetical protein